jgi:hypothetical protein
MKNKRCGNCGSFEVSKNQISGPFRWKDYPMVYLVAPVELSQCNACGELMRFPNDSEKIDAAIEASLKEYTQFYMAKVLDREKCKQIELAARLGVSPEYLSSLKAGAKIPSFQTFNFLRTLAMNEGAFQVADPENATKLARAG